MPLPPPHTNNSFGGQNALDLDVFGKNTLWVGKGSKGDLEWQA